MAENWYPHADDIDRHYVGRQVLAPAAAALVAMGVGFGVVAGLIFVAEGFLLTNTVTQVAGLALMYVVPHFVVGVLAGRRLGFDIAPAIAAGIAPVVFATLMFAVFGGPISTAVQTPTVTILAMLVWTLVFAVGLFAGSKRDGELSIPTRS
jgi:hypothetical protein